MHNRFRKKRQLPGIDTSALGPQPSDDNVRDGNLLTQPRSSAQPSISDSSISRSRSINPVIANPQTSSTLPQVTVTKFVTQTSTPVLQEGATTGQMVAAAISPFAVVSLIAAIVYFWRRHRSDWKASRRSLYIDSYSGSRLKNQDLPTPPSSPTKIKAYMLEKGPSKSAHTSEKSRKKPSIVFHPDLDMSQFPPKRPINTKEKESLASRPPKVDQIAKSLPYQGHQQTESNTSSRSNVQPLPYPKYPSMNNYKIKALAVITTTASKVSPADQYIAFKKEKGPRKDQVIEVKQPDKALSRVHSIQSTGSTLVLPVIKPVKSLKRKPAPDPFCDDMQPPLTAVSSKFPSNVKQKHITTATDSSFFCQGGASTIVSPTARKHSRIEEEPESPTVDDVLQMAQDLDDETARRSREMHARHSGSSVSDFSAVSTVPGAPPPSVSLSEAD